MSEPKWTPGPWEATGMIVSAPAVSPDPDYSIIADCYCAPWSDEQMWANAALCAAAPDLFDALVAMVAALAYVDDVADGPEMPAAHALAVAAIAKAGGQRP